MDVASRRLGIIPRGKSKCSRSCFRSCHSGNFYGEPSRLGIGNHRYGINILVSYDFEFSSTHDLLYQLLDVSAIKVLCQNMIML